MLGLLLTAVLGSCASAADIGQPRRVLITGYDDHAMEPFVSRDGRYLLFNNLNQAPANTDIHFAERQDDYTWRYRGKVNGINTPELEGCPTMDRAGKLYFVSPRNYGATRCTIYTGDFTEGSVTNVQLVESISLKQPLMVNFDVEVSPDGRTLFFVDSRFWPLLGPAWAHIVIAHREGDRFVRDPDSARLLREVNTGKMQFAPAISSNGLTLYFTRFDRPSGFAGPQIFRTVRASEAAPFGAPEHVPGLGDYVEGPAFSANERLLYFHRKDGARFNLYAVPIR
jgi:Tol biopolymer transport system component